MIVNQYTTNLTGGNGSWVGQLDGSGSLTFWVGGTVNTNWIAPETTQAPGLYQNLTGFPVTVNYQ